jgi:hypothetical protein
MQTVLSLVPLHKDGNASAPFAISWSYTCTYYYLGLHDVDGLRFTNNIIRVSFDPFCTYANSWIRLLSYYIILYIYGIKSAVQSVEAIKLFTSN